MDKAALIKQLTIDEGFRPSVYQDSVGVWTIGYGRMVDERLGGGISRAEAEILLSNDIDRCAKDLNKALPWWKSMSSVRQQALLNLCFNLGISRLLLFKNSLALLKAEKWGEAADAFLQSKWASQVGKRAIRVTEQIRRG